MTKSRRPEGRVVAFTRSAAYLRRRAQEQRKRGARMEAVELMHMALQQLDTPQNRLLLAEILCEMGNLPQAMKILYQLCAEDEVLPDVYYHLALCLHGMGNHSGAMDALYHELRQNPDADDARELMSEWMFQEGDDEAFRLKRLIHRANAAATAGDMRLARRRMRRAVRIAREPGATLIAWSAIEMEAGHPQQALRHVAQAWREAPQDPRTWSLTCLLLHRLGKPRAARGFLRKVSGSGPEHPPDDLVQYTACRVGDYVFLKRYMEARTRREDGNVRLLSALADACWQTGERERAHALWGRVLRIDPEDLRAWGLFHFPTQRWQPLPPFNSPPDVTMRQELARLADALGSGAGARELLARGSRLRAVTLWALTLPSAEIQRATLAALASGEDEDTRRALRDILVMPDVLPQVRQLALGRLAMLGEKGPHAMLLDGCLTLASCEETTQTQRSMWKLFLRLLLLETQSYGQSRQIAEFAAGVWRRMTPEQRGQAAGTQAYTWIKAMEALYLHHTGQDERLGRMMRRLPVSVRRIGRAVRALEPETKLPETAEGDKQP